MGWAEYVGFCSGRQSWGHQDVKFSAKGIVLNVMGLITKIMDPTSGRGNRHLLRPPQFFVEMALNYPRERFISAEVRNESQGLAPNNHRGRKGRSDTLSKGRVLRP